jgi:hypothetical protein
MGREYAQFAIGRDPVSFIKVLASGLIPPCIPTRVRPPDAPDWVCEIKHDAYRLQVRRQATTIRRVGADRV